MNSKKILSLVGLLVTTNSLTMNSFALGIVEKLSPSRFFNLAKNSEAASLSDAQLEEKLVSFIGKDFPKFLDNCFNFNCQSKDRELLVYVEAKVTESFATKYATKHMMKDLKASLDLLKSFKIGEKDKPVIAKNVDWNDSAKTLLNVYINFRLINGQGKGMLEFFEFFGNQGKDLAECRKMIINWKMNGIYNEKLENIFNSCKIVEALKNKLVKSVRS